MPLSRKDYEAVAAVIRQQVEAEEADLNDPAISHEDIAADAALSTLEAVAENLAAEFAKDNPRFDRGRFVSACGLA